MSAVGRRAVLRGGAAHLGLVATGLRALQSSEHTEVTVSSLPEAMRALKHPQARVRLRPGNHPLRNPQIYEGLSGHLSFEAGAKLLAVHRDEGGLRFVNCNQLFVDGLDLTWEGAAQTRSHFGAGVMFVASGDIGIAHSRIHGAPGAGLHFDVCQKVQVDTIRVSSSGADGVHFANCRQVQARALMTTDTGDDGVACVDYDSKPPGDDVQLSGLDIRASRARGLAVVGTARVSVTDFRIVRTASSGVLVAQDFHYKTRRPEWVSLTRGSIVNGGRLEPPAGNRFGIEVNHASNVQLSDIDVTSPFTRAVSAVNTTGDLRLSGLRVNSDAPGVPALECRHSEQVRLERIAISGGSRLAMLFEDCRTLQLESATLAPTLDGSDIVFARLDRIGSAVIGPMRMESPGRAVIQIESAVSGVMQPITGPDAPRLINRSAALRLEPVHATRR